MAPRKVMVISRGICRVMAVVALAIALLGAFAAQGALQFDVFLGYNDIVPERSWFPITCEVDNDAAPFNAVIEVSAGGLNSTPIRRVPIDLPTGTRKRVYIPVFSSGNTWDVRLVDESGRVLADQTLQRSFAPALRGFPVVAAIVRNVSGLPVFPEVITRQQPPAKFPCARLQAPLFPDNPLALEGINFLYLNSGRALELTVPQVNALVAWVESGGHLAVGVDQLTDVNSTPWLRNLLPCDMTAVTEAPVGPTLRAWLEGAAPPPLLAEPAHRQHFGTVQNGFNVPAPRVQNMPGIIVTITDSGVTYRTNTPGIGYNRRPALPMWLANTNGSFSRINPSALSNLLALRLTARSQTNQTAAPGAASLAAGTNDFDNASMEVVSATPRDGTVLIGNAASPLAVQAQRGRGLVTAVLFSPEREPFLSWDERPKFWTRLAGISEDMFNQSESDLGYMGGRTSSDALFGAMIDSKQVHKLPLGWLLALLAAYLVVIGPLDQYWLKKINRQMLTWVTFPCYVLLFSGLIYWIGFHLRNGELEWNELNIVDVLDSPDTTVWRGQTYVSIYSPVNGHYKLSSDQPYATVRGEFAGNYSLQESSHASVLQHGNNFQALADVPVWTSQLFVADWMQRGTDPLSYSLERTNGGWIVTVQNNLDHSVGPIRLAVEGRVYELGSLTPGQSKTNVVDRAQGESVESFTRDYAASFRAAVNQRQSNFGNNSDQLPDIASAAMAASFITDLNRSANDFEDYGAPVGLDLSRFARSGYSVLLAWDADHSLTSHLDQFKASRTHRRSLLRLVAPLPPPAT